MKRSSAACRQKDMNRVIKINTHLKLSFVNYYESEE